MHGVILRPRVDGVAFGSWQLQGALTRAAAVGSSFGVDSSYVFNDRTRSGHQFVQKLGAPSGDLVEHGARSLAIRLARLSGGLRASLKVALLQGEPPGGSLVFESDEIYAGSQWATKRAPLKPAEWKLVTDHSDLWVRVRVVRAQESGSLAISGIEFEGPEPEHHWQKLPANAPPLGVSNVLTRDGEVHRPEWGDGIWKDTIGGDLEEDLTIDFWGGTD